MAAAKRRAENIPPKPGFHVSVEWFGPEEAMQALSRNFERNRSRRKGWLAYLEQTLIDGEFETIHQGIAFDEDGFLIDGQHRLQAIANTGIGAWLVVARGVPRSTVLKMDLHNRRKPADQIRMFDPELEPNHTDVAIARMMATGAKRLGSSQPKPLASTPSVHEFLARHWAAIRFSRHHMEARRVGAAPIRAAIARAYYHEDRHRLEDFMRILATMLAESPRDHAAVNFRKWLDDDKNQWVVQGGQDRRASLYGLTVSSIRAFLRGLQGKGLKPVTAEEDPWPLPEDPN